MKPQPSQRKTGKPASKLSARGTSLKSAPRQPKNRISFSYHAADDKSILAIIDTIRTGILPQEFDKMVDTMPFSIEEWATYLHVSERTIQRNRKENKVFQLLQAERIVELVMLYEYGVEVFGNKENFNTWLASKSLALGGKVPKALLDTKFGIGLIKDELGRIEHGVLA